MKFDRDAATESGRHIPRSASARFKLWRYRLLPAITFLSTAALCAIIWSNREEGLRCVGEVRCADVVVASPAAGVIVQFARDNGAAWSALDQVAEGEIIAKLDDRQAKLDANLVIHEIDKLTSEIRVYQSKLTSNGEGETTSTAAAALLEELSALEHLRQGLKNAASGTAETSKYVPQEMPIASHDFQSNNSQAIAPNLLNFQQARTGLELRARQIQLELEKLVIRAPVSGAFKSIEASVGQAVSPGAVLGEIEEVDNCHILAFVPDNSRWKLAKGRWARIRTRELNWKTIPAVISAVSDHLQVIPGRHSGSSSERWGSPVKLELSGPAKLKPGSLVDVFFLPALPTTSKP